MGVGFYLICESNPLRWDDLMYQYVWLDHKEVNLLHPIDLNNRVDDFQEAFVSQCNHYKVMNGRFIVHYMTQCLALTNRTVSVRLTPKELAGSLWAL